MSLALSSCTEYVCFIEITLLHICLQSPHDVWLDIFEIINIIGLLRPSASTGKVFIPTPDCPDYVFPLLITRPLISTDVIGQVIQNSNDVSDRGSLSRK